VTQTRLVVADGDVGTPDVAAYEATRRDLVRRGLVTGGAVLAATSIPTLLSVRDAFAQVEGDEAILMGAITLEHTAVAAYGGALKSGKLDAKTTKVARLFMGQEQEHADALTAALKNLGGTPPTGPDARLLKPLAGVRTQQAIAMFAVELETMAVAAYYDAHRKLQTAGLLQAAAQIMSNEGQHLVVLRQALKRDPAPSAFENGKAST